MAAVNEIQFLTTTIPVKSIDDLRHPIADADVEIVQLGRGQLTGSLTKVLLPRLAFSKTDFSLPLRTSGILGRENLTIGMLLGSDSRSTSWGRDLALGDVFFSAPGRNFDGVFGTRSDIAGISIAPGEIAAMFAGEGVFADVDYWLRNHQYSGAPEVRQTAVKRVIEISWWLAQCTSMSDATADYWRRALVEAFSAVFLHARPLNAGETIPSTVRLVREVENHLNRHPQRAVHISELCAALGTSRRTLHRAFHDVLGIGPIAFLRHHRLCSIHSRLRKGDPSTTHVTDVATEFGFLELGRFSHYYSTLFGEYPSQTLQRQVRFADAFDSA